MSKKGLLVVGFTGLAMVTSVIGACEIEIRHVAELYAVLHSVNVAGVILIAAAVFANRAPARNIN